jgi:hypothetical protein
MGGVGARRDTESHWLNKNSARIPTYSDIPTY